MQIESATPCHDAQVVGPNRISNPLRLTVVAEKSEDYTTALQHLYHLLNGGLEFITKKERLISLTRIRECLGLSDTCEGELRTTRSDLEILMRANGKRFFSYKRRDSVELS